MKWAHGRISRRSALPTIALACSLLATHARADELEWKAEWRQVGGPEYIATASAFSAYLTLRFVAPKSEEAAWVRPILFDAPVRNALRIRARYGRDGTGAAADVLEYMLLAQSLVIDPWLVAGLARRSPHVGWQLFVLGAQGHSTAMLLNAASKLVVARERPYAEACRSDPGYHEACADGDRFRSFYSSHSSISATSAGLACAHHTNVSLYKHSAADIAACAGAGLLALSVGALRIVSDEHWATDVIAGQLIGFSIGYFLPTLLYYRQRSRAEDATDVSGSRLVLEPAPPHLLTFATAF